MCHVECLAVPRPGAGTPGVLQEGPDAMASTQPMARLYARLNDVGFPPDYIRAYVLPSWWDDHLGSNPAGHLHAAGLISRNLRLELDSLLDDRAEIVYREVSQQRMKLRQGLSGHDLFQAKCICSRAAEIACDTVSVGCRLIPQDASEIRREILGTGVRRVDLPSLLRYSWDHGIPVVHIQGFPDGAKKMDGMAAIIDGRPVTVLCKVSKYPAWHVFILAHELGHIALGHLSNNTVLADEAVSEDSPDAGESAANDFAVELLTGDPAYRYAPMRNHTGAGLAAHAKVRGEQDMVDPGVVALNYGRHKKMWGAAGKALQYLEPGSDAPCMVREEALRRLRLDELTEDEHDFFTAVTGGRR